MVLNSRSGYLVLDTMPTNQEVINCVAGDVFPKTGFLISSRIGMTISACCGYYPGRQDWQCL